MLRNLITPVIDPALFKTDTREIGRNQKAIRRFSLPPVDPVVFFPNIHAISAHQSPWHEQFNPVAEDDGDLILNPAFVVGSN